MKFNVKRRSFYLSLCVCALAVSAAGWSTYNSIKDFTESSKQQAPSSIIRKKSKTAEEIPKKSIDLSNLNEKPVYKIQEENLKEVSAKVSNPEFIIPMEYSSCTDFSDDLEYSEKFSDWRTSDGIDLKGNMNSDVCSMSNGKVEEIFDDPSYGLTAKIRCSLLDGSEVMSYYSGLNKDLIINKGDNVLQGQKIAKLENDTLHIMIQQNGIFINPYEILGIKPNETNILPQEN